MVLQEALCQSFTVSTEIASSLHLMQSQLYVMTTLYSRPLNPNIAADGWCFFIFKCPCRHLYGTVFSL
jgi:hypothetical protein